jgi:hypothetical protein
LAASRRGLAEYNRRMNAVVDYIDRHLDQKRRNIHRLAPNY